MVVDGVRPSKVSSFLDLQDDGDGLNFGVVVGKVRVRLGALLLFADELEFGTTPSRGFWSGASSSSTAMAVLLSSLAAFGRWCRELSVLGLLPSTRFFTEYLERWLLNSGAARLGCYPN
uniref:Uncharacterized protein n=1 Tax=Arundo donax TaxID=35708 RepID=A0A0A9A5N2_ARUDO